MNALVLMRKEKAPGEFRLTPFGQCAKYFVW
jgi:hypothetical protein